MQSFLVLSGETNGIPSNEKLFSRGDGGVIDTIFMFYLYICYPPYLDASECIVYYRNMKLKSLFVLTSVIISHCVLLYFVKVSLAAQKKWLECRAASMGGKKEDTDSLSQMVEENEEQRLYRQVMTVTCLCIDVQYIDA